MCLLEYDYLVLLQISWIQLRWNWWGKNRGGIDKWFIILYKSKLYPHVNNRIREKMQKFVFSYWIHDIHLTASLTLLTSINDLHKLHKCGFEWYCILNIFYRKENWYWWDKVAQLYSYHSLTRCGWPSLSCSSMFHRFGMSALQICIDSSIMWLDSFL